MLDHPLSRPGAETQYTEGRITQCVTVSFEVSVRKSWEAASYGENEVRIHYHSEKEQDSGTGGSVVRLWGEAGQGRTSWRKLGPRYSARQKREFRKTWGQGEQQRPCLKWSRAGVICIGSESSSQRAKGWQGTKIYKRLSLEEKGFRFPAGGVETSPETCRTPCARRTPSRWLGCLWRLGMFCGCSALCLTPWTLWYSPIPSRQGKAPSRAPEGSAARAGRGLAAVAALS